MQSLAIAACVTAITRILVHEQALSLTAKLAPFVGLASNPYTPPPTAILSAAYVTMFTTFLFCFYVYQRVRHLIPGRTRLAQILILFVILEELHGGISRDLFMQCFGSWYVGAPWQGYASAVVKKIDPWSSNLVLAAGLVMLSPRAKL